MKGKIRIAITGILAASMISCATGHYMELSKQDSAEVFGTVYSSFKITGAFRYRNTINRQAYITLLAEAQNKYPDMNIDIRDITWAVGQSDTANNNYEYTATGRIIKLPGAN